MDKHDSIVIGERIGSGEIVAEDAKITAMLSLPGFAQRLASQLRYEAHVFDATVREEYEREARQGVEEAFVARNRSDVGDKVYITDRIHDLEISVAAERSMIERTRYRQQIAELKELLRDQAYLSEQERAKRYALATALRKIDRPAREKRRKEIQKRIAEMRGAAKILEAYNPEKVFGKITVDSTALDQHACVFGKSGGGKSRFILHLLEQQLRAGCSVLCIDPKPEAAQEVLSMAIRAGLKPDEIIYVTPKPGFPVPGWNPFLITNETADTAAQAMFDLLKGASGGLPGVYMDVVLRAALQLCAAHRLSLEDVHRTIEDKEYAEKLASVLPTGAAGNRQFAKSAKFLKEFWNWPSPERQTSIRSLTARLDKVLDSEFARQLLCAHENTFELEDLWRRRLLILFSLDRHHLSEDNQTLVGSVVANMTQRAAIRVGSVKGRRVVLALDELGVSENMLGDKLDVVVRFARSQGLRVLVSSQNVTSVSLNLRRALLGNTSLRAFFQLSTEDASDIAPMFAAAHNSGKATQIVRLEHDAEASATRPDHSPYDKDNWENHPIGDMVSLEWNLMLYRSDVIAPSDQGSDIREDELPIPQEREFLLDDMDEYDFCALKKAEVEARRGATVARVTARISELEAKKAAMTSPPPSYPDDIRYQIEGAVRDAQMLFKDAEDANAEQAERDLKIKNDDFKRTKFYDSDFKKGFKVNEVSIASSVKQITKPDGTLVYVLEKVLTPIAPARKSVWQELIALFGHVHKKGNRTVYRPLAIPLRLAPFVIRTLDHQNAMRLWEGNTRLSHDEALRLCNEEIASINQWAIGASKQAEAEATDEWKRNWNIMREEFLARARLDGEQEFPGHGEELAQVRTSHNIDQMVVFPKPGAPSVDAVNFARKAQACGLVVRFWVPDYSYDGYPGYPILTVLLPEISATLSPEPASTTEAGWCKTLQIARKQEPAVWVQTAEGLVASVVRTVDVPDALPDDSPEFLEFAYSATATYAASESITSESITSEPSDMNTPPVKIEQAKQRRTLDDE